MIGQLELALDINYSSAVIESDGASSNSNDSGFTHAVTVMDRDSTKTITVTTLPGITPHLNHQIYYKIITIRN